MPIEWMRRSEPDHHARAEGAENRCGIVYVAHSNACGMADRRNPDIKRTSERNDVGGLELGSDTTANPEEESKARWSRARQPVVCNGFVERVSAGMAIILE